MSDTRTAHPDYASDVDEMILDYLIWDTANSFINAYRERERRSVPSPGGDGVAKLDLEGAYRLKLNMLDSFIEIYKQKHGGLNFASEVAENLELKIRLLQFLLQLAGPVLENSDYFRRDFDSPQGRPRSRSRHDNSSLLLLLPLLAEFLYLSANVVDMLDQNPNDSWMQLAAEFMLHTALNDDKVASAPGDYDSIEDAAHAQFQRGAWRYQPSFSMASHKVEKTHASKRPLHDSASERQQHQQHHHHHHPNVSSSLSTFLTADELALVNEMFHSRQNAMTSPPHSHPHPHRNDPDEIPGWHTTLSQTETLFAECLRRSSTGTHDGGAIDHVAAKGLRSLPALVDKLVSYGDSLLAFFGTPVLAQLEAGRLDALGLSAAETDELKDRCGWV